MSGKQIGAADFKARCLRLLDELGPEGLVVTKHGRPVARVLPFETTLESFIGTMPDCIVVHGDLFSTGLSWDAADGGVDGHAQS